MAASVFCNDINEQLFSFSVARLVDAQVDLVTHPQHTTVVEGQNATLICQLARVPPDELNPVIWKKGKSVISFNVLKS